MNKCIFVIILIVASFISACAGGSLPPPLSPPQPLPGDPAECSVYRKGANDVWNRDVRTKIWTAFTEKQKEPAANTARIIITQMDYLTRDWIILTTDLCGKNMIDKGIETDALTNRIECYESAFVYLKTFIELLKDADAQTVDNCLHGFNLVLEQMEPCQQDAASNPFRMDKGGDAGDIVKQLTRAHLLTALDNNDQAGEILSRIERDISNHKDSGTEAVFLLAGAAVDISNGIPDDAMDKYTTAAGILERINCTSGWSDAVSGIGEIAMHNADYENALEHFEQSESLAKQIAGKSGTRMGRLELNRGTVFRKTGRFTEALEALENSKRIFTSIYGPHHPFTASILNNIGLTRDGMGEYDTAALYYEKALDIYRDSYRPNHTLIASSLNNMAAALAETDRMSKAVDLFNEALDIYKFNYGDNHLLVASTLNNLGIAYDDAGHHRKAIGYFTRAMSIERRMLGPDHRAVAMRLSNIGTAWIGMGQYNRAVRNYKKALEIFRKNPDENRIETGIMYYNIGSTYHKGGNCSAAVKYYNSALENLLKTLDEDNERIKEIRKWKKKCTEQ